MKLTVNLHGGKIVSSTRMYKIRKGKQKPSQIIFVHFDEGCQRLCILAL